MENENTEEVRLHWRIELGRNWQFNVRYENFLVLDEYLAVFGMLTDASIIADVTKNEGSSGDEDVMEESELSEVTCHNSY